MGPHDRIIRNNINYWISWYPTIKKITVIFIWVFLSKKVFTKAGKSKDLLFDANLKVNIEKYIFEWNPEILYTNVEVLNLFTIYVLILRDKSFLFTRGKFNKYLIFI